MKRASTRAAGDEGELLAMEELRRRGFDIVEMKYRFGRGEIDIIARDGEVLVFCEVKTRKSDRYGPPEYAITKKKQAQIRKVATGYLFEHEIKDQECRFDVVAIRMWGGRTELNYIKNAF